MRDPSTCADGHAEALEAPFRPAEGVQEGLQVIHQQRHVDSAKPKDWKAVLWIKGLLLWLTGLPMMPKTLVSYEKKGKGRRRG